MLQWRQCDGFNGWQEARCTLCGGYGYEVDMGHLRSKRHQSRLERLDSVCDGSGMVPPPPPAQEATLPPQEPPLPPPEPMEPPPPLVSPFPEPEAVTVLKLHTLLTKIAEENQTLANVTELLANTQRKLAITEQKLETVEQQKLAITEQKLETVDANLADLLQKLTNLEARLEFILPQKPQKMVYNVSANKFVAIQPEAEPADPIGNHGHSVFQ